MKQSILSLMILSTMGVSIADAQGNGADVHRARISVKEDVKKTSERHDENSTRVNKNGDEIVTTVEIKTKTATHNLVISVFNTTPKEDAYQLEWFFFMEPVNGGKDAKPVLYEKGFKAITVPGSGKISVPVTPKTLTVTETSVDKQNSGNDNDNAGSSVTRIGDEVAGYVVQVSVNGTIIAKAGKPEKFAGEGFASQLQGAVASLTPIPKSPAAPAGKGGGKGGRQNAAQGKGKKNK